MSENQGYLFLKPLHAFIKSRERLRPVLKGLIQFNSRKSFIIKKTINHYHTNKMGVLFFMYNVSFYTKLFGV